MENIPNRGDWFSITACFFDLIFIVESKAIGIQYTDHIKIRLYQIYDGAFVDLLIVGEMSGEHLLTKKLPYN